MNADAQNYSLKSNNWFSLKVEYAGRGVARFVNPTGTIEGQTHVSYDETGKCTIEMEAENGTVGDKTFDIPFDLSRFLAGRDPTEKREGLDFYLGGARNPCESLTVVTSEGVFTAMGIEKNYDGDVSDRSKISFSPLDAEYEANSAAPPKYFVAPLMNFVNHFERCNYYPPIAHHPLRLFTLPRFPENLSSDEMIAAYVDATNLPLICFTFHGEPAFIEPLPDFEKRRRRLEKGRRYCQVTSVLVGSIASQEVSRQIWKRLGYRDLLLLLSIAGGNYVGSPWLEIRDEGGRLVRRIHVTLARQRYQEGIGALGHAVSKGGIGHFLNTAQTSEAFGRLHLRAIMSQIVMGGYLNYEGNIEDRLSHLFRALEALCSEYVSQKREAYLPNTGPNVDEIIERAGKEIGKLATALPLDVSGEVKQEIERESTELAAVVRRIKEAKASHPGFGKKIEGLLNKFELDDAKVLDAFIAKYPRPDKKKKWSAVVADNYRNVIMHHAWFNWEDERLDIKELTTMAFHLHDILVRIVLLLLHYDGEYMPSIIKIRGTSEEVKWIQHPRTSAQMLGYEPPK